MPKSLAVAYSASLKQAQWAYAQTEASHGFPWLRADKLEPLAAEWRDLF